MCPGHAANFCFEGFECVVPKLVEPAPQLSKSIRIDVIDAARSLWPIEYQSRRLQHFEMLRDSRATDWQSRRYLADRRWPVAQALENAAAGWVREGCQYSSVSDDLR